MLETGEADTATLSGEEKVVISTRRGRRGKREGDTDENERGCGGNQRLC